MEEVVKRVPLDTSRDPFDEVQIKSKVDFTTEERKQEELDNLAKSIISRTVPDKHVTKIIKCKTVKEMWDTLEGMCIGSEEINENKLSIACQKFDSFLMLKNESIDEMELRFNHILNENKPGFNQRPTNKLFSDLVANEFDIQRNLETKKVGGLDDDAPSVSKRAALKVSAKESKKQSNEPTKLKPETSSEKRESKCRYSADRSGQRKASTTDLKDVECYGCKKKGNYKSESPELSQAERKEMKARRDRNYAKKKVRVAKDAGSSEYASELSAFNSTSSVDENQALMAKDTESVADNTGNSYDNRMNGPEETTQNLKVARENSRLEEKLKISTSECERASHEIKRLTYKLEETVNDCMKKSPMMNNFPSKAIVENIGGKVVPVDKGKKVII
ncbi:uncharacterized protein LOC130990756 [Salvia miltiorrhiza]|uniref:uncharacterized protein LOC130990756 n=1 Tax=Salvia miltiorrhiza TaxID=226208 RepID=UPI0025AB7A6E|nr:uncharacterized protein LOC130990756 [Salvia miltiorrhiza]